MNEYIGYLEPSEGGGPGPKNIKVGTVTSTSTNFPTQRPDGDALHDEDYVTASGSVFPFTLKGVEFTVLGQRAYYDIATGMWSLDVGRVVSSTEVMVPASDNLLGRDVNQSEVNKLNKWIDEHRIYTHNQSSPSMKWIITHNMGTGYAVQGISSIYVVPKVTVYKSNGELINGGIVKYVDNDSLTIDFNIAVSGTAVLTI